MCGIWFLLNKLNTKLNDNNYYNCFMKTKHRGPDKSTFELIKFNQYNKNNNIYIGFHRLAINDLSVLGDQPFKYHKENSNDMYTICNGEIYNYNELKISNNLSEKCKSKSDCEILQYLYKNQTSCNFPQCLNGEFAFIITNVDSNGDGSIFICRDRFGVRPLFYVETEEVINFASEMKSLVNMNNVKVFPPSSYMIISISNNKMISKHGYNYYSLTKQYIPICVNVTNNSTIEENILLYEKNAMENIRNILTSVVNSMVNNSDKPIGALLSGGLDSSLICSIASKLMDKQLNTFSIGMKGSTDEYFARKTANFIGSNHTHVEFSKDQFLHAIHSVIYCTETYDITTIRATVGQYLISKWISENTDIKVLLIGDGSDELTGGYLYFHNSPSKNDLHNENIRLLNDIHYFDVLRADRGIASNGLEARVPFLAHEFVDYYLSIDPELRLPKTYKIEKGLLRKSFDNGEYLPLDILYRKKEAFSDGVSSQNESWYNTIQKFIGNITEEEYYKKIWSKWYSTESVLPYYWLPKWCGDVKNPSARVLNIYNL
jgi:asparagine synthase (glutamine-hydrolysing)